MFCRKCGKEITADVAFCRYCGANNPYYKADQAENKHAQYCRKCGKLIQQDSEFCCYCGTKVVVQSNSESPPPKEDKTRNNTESASQKKTWFWVLSSTIALVIVGIALVSVSDLEKSSIGSFLETNFEFANFNPEPDYLLSMFYYSLLTTVALSPICFIVGNIPTSRGPIKSLLNQHIFPIEVIALLVSLIGVVGGTDFGVITRVCAIICLFCFLYYCVACKYIIVPCVVAALDIALFMGVFDLPILVLDLWGFPMAEWSHYVDDLMARAEISQFVCVTVLICSIPITIHSMIKRHKNL